MEATIPWQSVNEAVPTAVALSRVPTTATEPTIRRLIRNRMTLEYYSASGWTTNAREAEMFKDSIEAARACITHNLRDVELVLHPGDAATELFRTSMR